MRYLLIYGTTEGQTRKIADFCANRLTEAGNEVELWDSRRRMASVDISSFEAIILAGSVHQRHHQETLTNFAIAHRDQLHSVPTLFISVSLSIAFENGADEAQNYVDAFIEYTGFKPKQTTLVAGALRFDEYDYFMSQIVEHVVLDNRGTITEDREFTDWDALGGTLDAFAASI